MLSAVTETINTYKGYKGESFLIIIGFAAILYIWILEDRKEIRQSLAFIPTIIMALFLFPVFSYITGKYFLEGGVYYRILWLIPFTMISSYALVRTLSRLKAFKKRLICILCFTLLIVQSGSLIYLNPLVKPAENLYQIPESVIRTADILHVEGREVKAVLPGEMLQFIRQYDPSINLAYGREALVEGWSDNPLYETMESNPVKSFQLTDQAKIQGVEYIVLRTGTGIVGTNPINHLEFTLIAQESGYDIYVFDRAEFAEAKKAEYLPSLPKDRYDYYIPGPTGPDTPYN